MIFVLVHLQRVSLVGTQFQILLDFLARLRLLDLRIFIIFTSCAEYDASHEEEF